MYHLIFVVKIKNNMRICIIGSGLTSLALAKALTSQNIYVDLIEDKKKYTIDQSRTIGITKSNVEYFNNNLVNIDIKVFSIIKKNSFNRNILIPVIMYVKEIRKAINPKD